MKSAILNLPLRSSDAPVSMFHTDYIIREYLFFIWIDHLKVDISLSIDILFMSVRQVYPEFRLVFFDALKFTETEMVWWWHPVCFHYFAKVQCFVVMLHTNKLNVESLLIQRMYYSYLYDQKWRSILRASDRTGTSICHAVSVNDLSVTDCVTSPLPMDFFSATKQLINFSRPSLFSSTIRGQP